MKPLNTILGIESSCDETAAAGYSNSDGLLSNIIATQSIHTKFGGVVPELASRSHQKSIWGTVEQALSEAKLSISDMDAIAVTEGPGLMGSLLVGFSFAKGLSLSQNLPLIGVNHMDAHIYANFINAPNPQFPFLALTVSGGHTQLIWVEDFFKHTILGQTRDDAAGEAFDKIGKMLGLPYPAGPQLDKLAQQGDKSFIRFPQANLPETYEFSYSGLKTAVLYHLQKQDSNKENYIKKHLNDLCASVSHAITEPLIKKMKIAIKEFKPKSLVLAGGVSANSMLRDKSKNLAVSQHLNLHIPKIEYCTDNAAMIAVTGYHKARLGMIDNLDLKPYASLAY